MEVADLRLVKEETWCFRITVNFMVGSNSICISRSHLVNRD